MSDHPPPGFVEDVADNRGESLTLPPQAVVNGQWAASSNGAGSPHAEALTPAPFPVGEGSGEGSRGRDLAEAVGNKPWTVDSKGAEAPATDTLTAAPLFQGERLRERTPATEDTESECQQQNLTTEEVEAILADFRSWFHAVSSKGGAPATFHSPEAPATDELIDLHTLLGQFTALRHDVNLQTKATRSQQELNTEMLRQLGQAFEGLKQAQAASRQADEEKKADSLRPVLKALIEAHDALTLAEREVVRVRETLAEPTDDGLQQAEPDRAEDLLALLDEILSCSLPSEATGQPYENAVPFSQGTMPGRIRRLFGWFLGARQPSEVTVLKNLEEQLHQCERRHVEERRYLRERLHLFRSRWGQFTQAQLDRERCQGEKSEQALRLIDAVSAGYAMSIQRLQRILEQHGLEVIPTAGYVFDPELMEVVEAVVDPTRQPGEVVGELRRGYLWHGRVFRFAQVRVASG